MTTQWLSRMAALPWQTWLAHAPDWLALLGVLLLGKLASDLTLQVVSPGIPQNTSTASRAVNGQESAPRLRTAVSHHLFGQANQVTTEAAPITAEKTKLNLILRGLFADVPERAMAIIADAKGDEALYKVGATVPGGARVHAIYEDKVILERNGRFESLHLPRDELPQNAVSEHSINQNLPVREAGADSAEKLRALRETLINDPQKLWQQVRIEPVLSQGRIKGYRLSHNDRQLMRSLGIRDSDIITAVNGRTLEDPKVLYDLMTEFNTAQQIRLTVERAGQSEVLLLHL